MEDFFFPESREHLFPLPPFSISVFPCRVIAGHIFFYEHDGAVGVLFFTS